MKLLLILGLWMLLNKQRNQKREEVKEREVETPWGKVKIGVPANRDPRFRDRQIQL